MAKKKRLTNREKKDRAEFKKQMQEKGILPLDKPKLNRKKFIEEAREEWNGRDSECYIWEHYLMEAMSYMLTQREGMSSRASLEAVGAAKVLKVAIRLREFSEMVRAKGENEYKLTDQYNYIKDILDAKYVTIRKYISKEDFYVTSANMMSPEGSDYAYAEDVRVSNRLVKAVRAAALDELQVEIDPGDIETSIANIQEQLATPVEDAVRDKIISSGTVAIDTENLNILVDESLDVRISAA